MNPTAPHPVGTDVVVEDTFAHAPETVWKALTTGALIGRWLMEPKGFAAVEGTEFIFQTTPGGAWDGVIRCKVLEVVPNRRISYAWKGGHPDNTGYGAPLDSVVTWTLTPTDGGTQLRLVHSGFVSPTNDAALKTMGEGWKQVVPRIGAIAGELH
ncbi:MAG: SRPBCC domain-containing protein [Pseudomonadota bacterium]